MNVVDLLKDGTALDLLIDAAASNNYGGLITSGELLIAIEDEGEESAVVLRKVLTGIHEGAVVAKVYTKGSNIKVVGPSVHLIDGVPGLFGQPLPKGVSLSKTKEKRGSGDREYTAPIARLSMKSPEDEDELISLDFDFAKPVGTEDYFAWCMAVCNANKATLIEDGLIGEWVEPTLNPSVGMDRVNLEAIPPGKYQITGLKWEERLSKANNPYKVWSLALTSADREFVTWDRVLPKSMDVGAVQIRMLDKGKLMVLDVKGLRDQQDKQGRVKLNDEGRPYQELDARIYAVDSLPLLSSLAVVEADKKPSEYKTQKVATPDPVLEAAYSEEDDMPF
jgi:hypothetical protein